MGTTVTSEHDRAGARPDELRELYRTMVLIRRCEERLVKSYQAGLIVGPCHTYIGQEAVAAGVCAHLRPDDLVFSTHRGHGHALAKGVEPREVLAELYGRVTGCSLGRGGSMHLFKPEVGLMGTSGIVGPSILLAAGAAYSFLLAGSDRVAVAFFGDGATNNGAFHEGLNLASVWKLPVVFVCENNLYGTEVALRDAAGNPDIASRASAYGLRGESVDGNDVEAVYRSARRAVDLARTSSRPTLLECKTYRTRPHSEGMRDDGYRTADEVTAWKERCPIALCRAALAHRGLDPADLDVVDAEIDRVIEGAHEVAERDPWPDPATVYGHAFSDPGLCSTTARVFGTTDLQETAR